MDGGGAYQSVTSVTVGLKVKRSGLVVTFHLTLVGTHLLLHLSLNGRILLPLIYILSYLRVFFPKILYYKSIKPVKDDNRPIQTLQKLWLSAQLRPDKKKEEKKKGCQSL